MSKKDYQAIARVLHSELREWGGKEAQNDGALTVQAIARGLADVLAADSPRFDRARFLEACETGKCKGMR